MLVNVTTLDALLYASCGITNKGLVYSHKAGSVVETPITALPSTAVSADVSRYQDFFNGELPAWLYPQPPLSPLREPLSSRATRTFSTASRSLPPYPL